MKKLKFVKTFEEMKNSDSIPVIDLNSKKLKFKWKRYPMEKYARNELRGFSCVLNGISIGTINNISNTHYSKDTSEQWYIMYHNKGNNIILKKRFDLDKIDEAKKFFEETFLKILSSTPENDNLFKMKISILALNRFKIND